MCHQAEHVYKMEKSKNSRNVGACVMLACCWAITEPERWCQRRQVACCSVVAGSEGAEIGRVGVRGSAR